MHTNRPKSFVRPFTSLQTVFEVNHDWHNDDTLVEGTREKFALESSTKIDLPLLGSHPYIFKYSKPGREGETWAEILASYIGGEILGLNVQRTFLAVDCRNEDKRVGVLIESFLKKPYLGDIPIPYFGPTVPLIHGGHVIARVMPNYDFQRGDQHSIQLVRKATDTENRYNMNEAHFIEYWAKLLAFDMLINNGDRHQENWGVMQRDWTMSKPIQMRNELGQYSKVKDVFQFSPIFDNAAGFASEIDPIGLSKKLMNAESTQDAVKKYAMKGRPHPGYDAVLPPHRSRKTLSFFDLMKAFLHRYPSGRKHVFKIANVDMARVKSAIGLLKAIDIGISDADVRAGFIENLIRYRKNELLKVCK